MRTTPGALRQFASREHKAAKFCLRMVARNVTAAVKRKFSKSAADHQDLAESVETLFVEGYHNVECR